MSDEPRITHAAIRYARDRWDMNSILGGGSASAVLTWSDGHTTTFAWYHDEITFRHEEFIGKTQPELDALFMKKDMEYLRSP
jgi:hypothetical protein